MTPAPFRVSHILQTESTGGPLAGAGGGVAGDR